MNMKKRMALLLCMIFCALMVAGCSLVPKNDSFDKKELESQTDAMAESWFAADFQTSLDQYRDQMDEDTIQEYEGYIEKQKRYQGIKKKVKTTFTINSDSATVSEVLLCDNGEKMIFSLSFAADGNIQTTETGAYVFNVDEYKSVGQTMARAGLNTIMSMAIVFCVLIFISLLISCFTLINKVQDKADTTTGPASAAPAPAPSAPAAGENLTDDLELVAVITAAIAASSGAESTDGLVVRSIIRRG